MAPFLLQLASQGVVVITNGAPGAGGAGNFASFGKSGQSSYKSLLSSIDWVAKNAGMGKWVHLDSTRIAAAGQSCGGGETYGVANDPRVKVLGIFNSGGMMGMGGNSNKPAEFKKPIFYFLGGPSDMAYKNVRMCISPSDCSNNGIGKKDISTLPAGLPAWLGNWAPTGHGGTYNQLNGGVYGVAGSRWVNWVLRVDSVAGKWFTDNASAQDEGWTDVESKNLDKFQPLLPPFRWR